MRLYLLIFALLFTINISNASTFIDFEDMEVNGYDGMIIYQSYFEVPLNYNVTFDNYTEGASGMITCNTCNPYAYSGSWASTNPDYANTELSFLNNINSFSVWFAVPVLSEGTTLTVNAYDENNNLISTISNTNALNSFQLISISGNNIRKIWLNHSDVANTIVYDDINFTEFDYIQPVSISSDCTFLDFSNVNWYDVSGYLRVILNWLYTAPACYFTLFWNNVYNFIYNIISIPLGIISSIINGFVSLFTNILGIFTDLIGLGNNITGVFSSTIGLLFDNAWMLIISSSIIIVILLRIQHFIW